MDSVTLITPSYQLRTGKQFELVAELEGRSLWKKTDGARIAQWDVLEPGDASTLDALATTLRNAAARNAVAVRASAPDKKSKVRRRGDVFTATARRWVCIDIDEVPLKDANSIEELIALTLPPPFHHAGHVAQLSSSAGMRKAGKGLYEQKGECWKIHLWFLLEEAHEDAVLRSYFKQNCPKVDWRTLVSVQPHFVADPVFHENGVRLPDPLCEHRWSKVDGPRVHLAACIQAWQEEEQVKKAKPQSKKIMEPIVLPKSQRLWNADALGRLGENALNRAVEQVALAKTRDAQHKALITGAQLLAGLAVEPRTGLTAELITAELAGAAADKSPRDAVRAISWGLSRPFNRVAELEEAGKQEQVQEQADGLSNKVGGATPRTVLSPEQLTEGRYIPNVVPKSDTVIVKAPQGSGKTQWVGNVALPHFRSAHEDARVLYVVHRRSMAKAASSRLGLPCYMDSAGTLKTDCVVSVDSLHRVELNPDTQLILVLDEVEQVLHHLAMSGTMNGEQKLRAHNAWLSVLAHAVCLVAMDADLGQLTLSEIEKHAPAHLRVLKRAHLVEVQQGGVDWGYTVVESKDWLEDHALQAYARGEKVAIACQSRKQAEALSLRLRDIRGRVGLVTSKSILDDDGRRATENPSGWAAEQDAIVYSPTWGTAVSITCPGFKRVYAFGSRNVGTAMDLLQAAHRVRNPADRNIMIHAPKGGAEKTTEPEEIAMEVLSLASRTRQLIQEHLPGVQVPSGFTPTDQDMAARYGRVVGHVREWGAQGCDLYGALVNLLNARCLRYTELSVKLAEEAAMQHREENKEARHQVAADWAAVVASAEEMSIKEAEKLKDAATLEEAAAAEKALIKDFYGKVSEEIIQADSDGRLRSQARAYSDLKLALEGRLEGLAWADASSVTEGQAVTAMRHRYMKAVATRYALQAAGDGALTGSDLNLETLKDWALRNAEILGLLGNTVRNDIATRTALWLSNLLRRYGLKLAARRVQRDGKRVRIYTVCPESIAQIREASAWYHQSRKRPGPAYTEVRHESATA